MSTHQVPPEIEAHIGELAASVIANIRVKHGLDREQARAALRRQLDRIEDRQDAKAWRAGKP